MINNIKQVMSDMGKISVKKRLGGKSKKEKSAIMRKVRLARFKKPSKKYLKEVGVISKIVDSL